MSGLDLFSIGSWTIFDHLMRVERLPRDGETMALAMPDTQARAVHFGDCSANIAAVAARLGLRVGLGMVVGEDFETSGYRAHLGALGVDLAGVEIRAGAGSGHSYNVFDAANRSFCISHLGIAADQTGWAPPLAAMDGARCVVASEMFSPYTLGALEWAKGNGRLTAINGMVASAGADAARFLAATDLLFLSRGEAEDLKSALGLAQEEEILAFGPRLVVVTRGSEGSLWFERGRIRAIPAVPAERFVDSTGAGDSFVAGALTGLLAGLAPEIAGRLAATVASFVVEDWGCQTNLPDRAALARRYARHFGESLPA